MSIPRQTFRFDEHRNTSRVWPVTERDAENARRALAAFRRDDPTLYAWVAAGAPRMTEDEHVARFGVPYRGVKSRKEAPSPQ